MQLTDHWKYSRRKVVPTTINFRHICIQLSLPHLFLFQFLFLFLWVSVFLFVCVCDQKQWYESKLVNNLLFHFTFHSQRKIDKNILCLHQSVYIINFCFVQHALILHAADSFVVLFIYNFFYHLSSSYVILNWWNPFCFCFCFSFYFVF